MNTLIQLVLLFSLFSELLPQTKMRTIEKVKRESGSELCPIEVVDFRIGNAFLKQGVAFIAGDDWIIELETTIKNVSPYTITNLIIAFDLPSASQLSPVPIAWLGEKCDYASTPSDTVIKPGESITVKFNKNDQAITGYKNWRKFIAEKGVLTIEQVRPVIESVLLGDGRRWSRGYFLRKNASNPSLWEVVN